MEEHIPLPVKTLMISKWKIENCVTLKAQSIIVLTALPSSVVPLQKETLMYLKYKSCFVKLVSDKL